MLSNRYITLLNKFIDIAEELSQKFNYVELRKERLPETKAHYYYESKPKIEEGRNSIVVRDRFSNIRIDIYGPKGWFVSLEYNQYGEFKEAQVFNDNGVWKLIEMKKIIDAKLKEE